MIVKDQTARPISKAPRVVEEDCDICDGTGAVPVPGPEGSELGAREPCVACQGRGSMWVPR